MDPDKLLKFLSDNLAEWSRVVARTLLLPVNQFAHERPLAEGVGRQIAGSPASTELWLNPKLLWFASFSALLGTVLNAMLPGRVQAPSLLSSTVVIVVSWLCYGSVAHVLCRVLRGKADFLSTLSLSIQVSATLYVVVSFLSLILAAVIAVPVVAAIVAAVPLIGSPISKEPALSFFLVGAVLTSIYQPLALRRLHRLGWFGTGLLAALPYLGVWFSIAVYRAIGIMLKSVIWLPG